MSLRFTDCRISEIFPLFCFIQKSVKTIIVSLQEIFEYCICCFKATKPLVEEAMFMNALFLESLIRNAYEYLP